MAAVGTNLIIVNYLAGPKVWAAGETIALRATFTLTPPTERSVEVLFHSESNGPEGPGDTLAFVPSRPSPPSCWASPSSEREPWPRPGRSIIE